MLSCRAMVPTGQCSALWRRRISASRSADMVMGTSTSADLDPDVGESAAHTANDADNDANGRGHRRFRLRRHQDVAFDFGGRLIGHGPSFSASPRSLGIAMIGSALRASSEPFARRRQLPPARAKPASVAAVGTAAVAPHAEHEQPAASTTAPLQDKSRWTCVEPKAMVGWLFCVLLTQLTALRLRVAARGLILFTPCPESRPDAIERQNESGTGCRSHETQQNAARRKQNAARRKQNAARRKQNAASKATSKSKHEAAAQA